VVDTIAADNAEDIAALGKRLSATLQFHPDNFVAHAANSMETRAEAVFRYGQIRQRLPKNAHLPASQYMGFYPRLQCVERYLAHIDASALLIRDEDAQYGEALAAAVEHGTPRVQCSSRCSPRRRNVVDAPSSDRDVVGRGKARLCCMPLQIVAAYLRPLEQPEACL
jgi:hypothetical protein